MIEKPNPRLPRKTKKLFIKVKGLNEYRYQRSLLRESRFKFMNWNKFETVTKQRLKYKANEKKTL